MNLIEILTSVGIALLGWVLLEIIKIKVDFASFRVQIGRIISDIESEKGTRKRLHDDYETRFRTLERGKKP